MAWGHTYQSTTNPLLILQKKTVRLITFNSFDAHADPIFKKLNLLKFPDLVTLYTALFMYDFYNKNLPSHFDTYFTLVKQRHNYNTRNASNANLTLPKIRTNYGKFNIRFSGAKIWNSLSESVKKLSRKNFNEKVTSNIISLY